MSSSPKSRQFFRIAFTIGIMAVVAMASLLGTSTVRADEPPALPSSFWGYIHFSDGGPDVGDLVVVYKDGVQAQTAVITLAADPTLGYVIDVPGTALDQGKLLTFKIRHDGSDIDRVVATGTWSSGMNVHLDLHPPQALPGGSYSDTYGTPISFTGEANDWGSDVTAYDWDWGDGTPHGSGTEPSHSYLSVGLFTVTLKVTDAQGGVGTATVGVRVDPKLITVTADAKTKVYGDSDPALTYIFTPALVGSDSFTGELTRVAGETVGNYAIQQGTLALSSNYALSYTGANLTITQRSVTVTADAKSKVYGDTDPALTYQITSGSLAFTDAFTGELTRVAGETVGDYAIQQGTLALSSNYALSYTGANLTITQRSVTVTADAKSKVYGDTDPALTYQITSGSLAFTDAFTGELTRVAGETVGNYAIQQGTLALSSNYALSYTGANLTITQRSVTVTADAKSKVYGDTDPALTYQITSGSLAFTDAFTGELTRAAGETVGNYAIQQGTLALSSNYALSYTGANLTITARLLTITANNQTKTAGTVFTFLGTEFRTGSGQLVNGDTVTGVTLTSTGAPAAAAAGTYPIVVSNAVGTGLSNYAITYVNGTLLVENTSHSLSLVPGWNLVSFNLHPVDTSPSAVLASIANHYDLVYTWDASVTSDNWKLYDPGAIYASTLTALDEKTGFWIHVTGTDHVVLNVTGSVPTSTSIGVFDNAGGWNLVGFPAHANRVLPDAFGTIAPSVSLAYAYHAVDASDPWMLYDADAPDWSYDMKELSPGWGYWVKVNADGTWTVTY